MKIVLIGFGVVGQGFAEILRDKATMLQETQGFSASIVAVATRSRGTLYDPNGLHLDSLLEAIQQEHLEHYPDSETLQRDWDVLKLIREAMPMSWSKPASPI